MHTYIAVSPSVLLVRSLLHFYVEQQTWVSTQLESTSPTAESVVSASPSPAPRSLSGQNKKKRALTPSASSSRRHRSRTDAQSRLHYLPRHSHLLKRHHATKPRTRASSSFSSATSRPSVPPVAATPPPSAPSPGAAALLEMYGAMIGERMQSCMRLEEMVRDAHGSPRDLFWTF